MNSALPRALLWLAFALALVIVTTSSGLRLAADGLGCSPWPRCYGAQASPGEQPSAPVRIARLAHRIAASAFALVVVAAVALGWRRWPRSARRVAMLLLGVVASLAAVGRVTPSPIPAVTLVNVVGGLALLGATAFLLATARGITRTTGPPAAIVALLCLVALQAATGAMISVREAGAACAGGCDVAWPTDAPQLWAPQLPGTAEAMLPGQDAGAAIHAVHRLGAALIVVAFIVAAFAPPLRAAPMRWAAALMLALCVGAGGALYVFGGSLPAAVAHVLSAGLLVAALSVLRSRGTSLQEAT
jgi:cytochrome c oxidase assembly protein subunit 15